MLLHWMLYSALVSMLLALAAAGIESLFGTLLLPRRAAWFAALSGSVLVSLAALGAPKAQPAAEGIPVTTLPMVTIDPLVSTLAGESGGADLTWVLVAAWIAVSGVLVALLMRSLRALHRQRPEWEQAIVRGRSVWISEKLGPAVFGVRRPGIVMPRWALRSGDAAQELILAHEEEHIRARDLPLLLGGTLLVVIFPWNLPLIWQVRRLRQAVELDCDRRVLAGGFDPVRYGRLLLDVDGATAGRMMVAGLLESPSLLERRIRTMLSLRAHRLGIGACASVAIAIVAVVGVTRLESPRELVGAPIATVEDAVANRVDAGMAGPSAAPATRTAARSSSQPTVAGGADAGQVVPPYPPSELDSPPQLLNVPEILALMPTLYPRILLDAGISGRVEAEMVVNADGSVDPASIRIIGASNDRFIEPSRQVVERFRYSPGVYEGAPVRVILRMPIGWEAVT